ncbi:oligopeptide transporter 7 [Quercus suber]|uniref:Oligopeptide transporter 7 n=1 Tax=Quercus suber TaxID=58331 RepID=A0AAW0KD87_QUESU
MDSRNPSMWPPLLSQPILLVPQRGSHTNVDLGSDHEIPKPKIMITDDTSLPSFTFQTWILRTLACDLLSFLNQFF